MITNQAYFRSAANVPQEIIRSAPLSLRSNRVIDSVLREAYRKYDRTEQTQRLLRRYLLG
jgi:hypothetical protein